MMGKGTPEKGKDASRIPPLTASEMRAWQKCPRGWWLRYYRRLRKIHDLPSLPNIGNLVHAGLQAYYRDTALNPSELVAERATALNEQYPEFGEQIVKDAELAVIMLDGYLEWLETEGADAGLEYVGSEQTVEAEVGPYVLRGKIDARLRRSWDGALLQLEHKTVGDLVRIPKYAQSAPQFLTYDLLAFLTKPDGVATDGVLINMLRRVKRTARAKPPFYGRHPVYHNVHELRAHYKHVVALGDQISAARKALDEGRDHQEVIVPAVDDGHTWSCDCHEVCTMFDDGSDVEPYLSEFYETFDPWERYDVPEEEAEV